MRPRHCDVATFDRAVIFLVVVVCELIIAVQMWISTMRRQQAFHYRTGGMFTELFTRLVVSKGQQSEDTDIPRCLLGRLVLL